MIILPLDIGMDIKTLRHDNYAIIAQIIFKRLYLSYHLYGCAVLLTDFILNVWCMKNSIMES